MGRLNVYSALRHHAEVTRSRTKLDMYGNETIVWAVVGTGRTRCLVVLDQFVDAQVAAAAATLKRSGVALFALGTDIKVNDRIKINGLGSFTVTSAFKTVYDARGKADHIEVTVNQA